MKEKRHSFKKSDAPNALDDTLDAFCSKASRLTISQKIIWKSWTLCMHLKIFNLLPAHFLFFRKPELNNSKDHIQRVSNKEHVQSIVKQFYWQQVSFCNVYEVMIHNWQLFKVNEINIFYLQTLFVHFALHRV